jgi:uncharacterized protein
VVEHNEAAARYETRIGEAMAVLEYKRRGKIIIFTHTGVPKPLEAQGIAGRLAQVALDDARAQHLTVIPLCPFVAAYVRRHKEHQDILHPSYRQPR